MKTLTLIVPKQYINMYEGGWIPPLPIPCRAVPKMTYIKGSAQYPTSGQLIVCFYPSPKTHNFFICSYIYINIKSGVSVCYVSIMFCDKHYIPV